MAVWFVKAGVQAVISALPGAHAVNGLVQHFVTGRGDLTDDLFDAKLVQARRHVRRYKRVSGGRRVPRAVFELGTGWYPIVPIALALLGARRVVSFDVQPLATGSQVRRTLERFVAYREDGRLRERLPGARERRLPLLDECLTMGDSELLAPLGVELHVGDRPANVSPAGVFELVVSNNTLEHIPRPALEAAMRDTCLLLIPGGVMDHFIDMRDHYAEFDATLSRLNFLRYPDPLWRLVNNRLQYVNRLRLPEYRKIIEAAGLRICEQRTDAGRHGEFDDLNLARRFRHMPREEVLVLGAWVTAVKPPAGRPAERPSAHQLGVEIPLPSKPGPVREQTKTTS